MQTQIKKKQATNWQRELKQKIGSKTPNKNVQNLSQTFGDKNT